MKLKQFKNFLKKEKIDLAIFFSPDSNITYFTQIKPTQALLVITQNSVSLHLSQLDKPPRIKGIYVQEMKKDWHRNLTDKKVKKIGINEDKITYKLFQKLKKIYPKAKFIDVSPELKQLRLQKTEQEIKHITKACKITVNAFNSLVKNFKKNKFKTESDIAFYLEKKIREQGAELAFPTIVATGRNSSVPHHITGKTRLKLGFLQLDFGACYKNYCADMSRILYLGTMRKEEKDHYTLLLNVQRNTIKRISSNNTFISLDKLARTKLGKFSSYFIHGLGHGVGIDIHELPSFRDEKQRISNNQVFTIEPGIYLPRKYGLRIEDTILFNKKAKILTKATKNLIQI